MGASAGRVLLIPKGDWNANTTYTGLDWVRHNGAAWVCKNTCTNIEPTLENADNWQIMARDGDMVTADTAMSDSSTNAVQNKVIKSYVDDKFSFADHDTATSGTSFTDAEDGNMLVTDWTKNLLNHTLETTTNNGVTCTRNVYANGKPDGTYTLNGTATGQNAVFELNIDYCIEYGKTYRLVGCPKSGALGKYGLEATDKTIYGSSDFGDGVIFNPYETGYEYKMLIVVYRNYTVNNLIFKPMLTTDFSATYDDFVPYGGYEIQSCGKNLLNPTLQTTTRNGVTCTNNGDGTYTLNGTATSQSIFWLNENVNVIGSNLKLVCCPPNVISNIQGYSRIMYDNDEWGESESGDGVVINSGRNISKVIFTLASGCAVNNLVIKPMITTDLSVTYDDFEPYTGETITVTNTTESPAFGLKSHKGITNIISPGNVKCVYPTNESGKGVLDAMYNNSQLSNELSKLKNAIIAMGGTV